MNTKEEEDFIYISKKKLSSCFLQIDSSINNNSENISNQEEDSFTKIPIVKFSNVQNKYKEILKNKL